MPQHVAVETAGKAAVRHNHDEQHVLHFVVLAQQRVIRATYTLVALANISTMDSEYGVAAATRSPARRIFAAATISMVRVICFVEETEPIPSSCREGWA